MGLVDPVKIYAASSNVQAQLICRLLEAEGVETFAGEDLSPAGAWLLGTNSGVFDAGVFVSRADAERATALILDYERREAERSSQQGRKIRVTCEECGERATFPAAQHGTVQNCPSCGAYIDVDELRPEEGPGEDEILDAEEADPE